MKQRRQIPLEEAIAIVQSHAALMGTERVGIRDSYGRTLAEDLKSFVNHPSTDNSAMDGYACREADTREASPDRPVRLKVIGDLPAGGDFSGLVGPGQALSIYTGASIPEGADAIIMVEKTERRGDEVLLHAPASPKDIRPRAQDLTEGQTYLFQGMTLDPAAVGVAASMGHAKLQVRKRPRVGILATGDELVEPGQPIRDGQLYNSNTYTLTGLILEAGAEAVPIDSASDTMTDLTERIAEIGGLDLLLTSGGVSMGKYDLVRDLLFEQGEVHFWKVNVKPGGPALFGSWQGLPIFGLPGNPVSSAVVFLLLARAWIHAALGSTEALPYRRRVKAKAGSAFRAAGFKETFPRGILEFDLDTCTYKVTSTGNQSSGVFTSMLRGNALVVLPPHADVKPGDWVEVIPF